MAFIDLDPDAVLSLSELERENDFLKGVNEIGYTLGELVGNRWVTKRGEVVLKIDTEYAYQRIELVEHLDRRDFKRLLKLIEKLQGKKWRRFHFSGEYSMYGPEERSVSVQIRRFVPNMIYLVKAYLRFWLRGGRSFLLQ